MNETVHSILHSRARGRSTRAGVLVGAVTAVLVAAFCTMFLLWGCADKRTIPTQSSELGYTETIVLFDRAVSTGDTLRAVFTVPQQLAPIETPGVDTPARMVLTTYIRPDHDVLWWEAIVNDSAKAYTRVLGQLTIRLGLDANTLDALKRDSLLCATFPDTCTPGRFDSIRTGLRTLRGTLKADSIEKLLRDSIFCVVYADSLDSLGQPRCDSTRRAQVDTLLMTTYGSLAGDTARLSLNVTDSTAVGLRRDSLSKLLDSRYTLAMWLDADTTTAYPEGVFTDTLRTVAGQALWNVPTDSTTGLKGRGFQIPMDRFSVADPTNLNLTRTVNWTTCFAGSTKPCMGVGQHELKVRITGGNSQITGAVMLVYAERRRS